MYFILRYTPCGVLGNFLRVTVAIHIKLSLRGWLYNVGHGMAVLDIHCEHLKCIPLIQLVSFIPAHAHPKGAHNNGALELHPIVCKHVLGDHQQRHRWLDH